MFGYVTIYKPELKFKEYFEYKAYYCGLCTVSYTHLDVYKRQHGGSAEEKWLFDFPDNIERGLIWSAAKKISSIKISSKRISSIISSIKIRSICKKDVKYVHIFLYLVDSKASANYNQTCE